VNHIPFVTHITFWNLKSMLKLVQMYSVLILQCRKNVLCLAPCCLIQWNLHFTFLDSTRVLIGSTTASIGMWNFPWMFNWSSYPVPWIYAQIEHEQTCCSHFKFSQLGIRKKYAYLSCVYLCSLLIICTTHCVQWSNLVELPALACSHDMVVRPRPLLIAHLGYTTLHNRWSRKMSTTCVEWINDSCPHW